MKPIDRPRRGRRIAAACSWFLVTTAVLCGAQPVNIDLGTETASAVPPPARAGSPFGRRIVELRYKPASLPRTELALARGDTLTPQNLSAALNQVASHLSRHSEMLAALSGNRTLIFTYVDAEFDLNPDGTAPNDTVAVELRPFHLNLPLDDMGGMILPVPRGVAEQPEFLKSHAPLVPAGVTLANDRVLGTTIGGRWQLAVGADNGDPRVQNPIRLRAGAMKAIDTSFYSLDSDARLE